MTIWSFGKSQKKEKLIPGTSGTSGAAHPTALVDAVTAPNHGFGIRSYLHQFYQSPTTDESPSANWYLLPPPPAQRRGLFFCHVMSIVGLLILLGGAATIVAGYTWPHESVEDKIMVKAGYRYEMSEDGDRIYMLKGEDIDKLSEDPMRQWKMTGLCIFSTGAFLLAVSLLIPAVAQCFRSKRLAGFVSEDATPNEPPIRIYPSVPSKPETRYAVQAPQISPNTEPVPVVEEITKVQPAEGKITGEGTAAAADFLLSDADIAKPTSLSEIP